ncbi:mitotic checkpoint serine/threonine-protein kinase BUB1 [Anomaloglossus baeobatrachus]|uniref:mitotic checkpoint serine/threonine-protein kinase BUB1 n=1 Tax=Anomaloglossus baeobatrachus TaxID=238106 RepID=UPI003F5017D4
MDGHGCAQTFQMTHSQKNQPGQDNSVQPLKDSQVVNQMVPGSEIVSLSLGKCQDSTDGFGNSARKSEVSICRDEPRVNKYVTISKSAVVPQSAPSSTEMKQVPMYCKDKLVCGDSEMSIEEYRAIVYIKKHEQRKKIQLWGDEEKKYMKFKDEAMLHEHMLKEKMEQLNNLLNVQGSTRPSSPEKNHPIQPGSAHAGLVEALGPEAAVLPVSSVSGLHQAPISALSTEIAAPPQPQTSPSLGFSLSDDHTLAACAGPQLSMLSAPDQHFHSILQRPDPVSQQSAHEALADCMFIMPNAPLERSTSTIHDSPKPLGPNCSVLKLQPAVRENTLLGNLSGLANVSHVTPNTSLGFVQATPSKVLPSPTVNTKEALGFIMDIFQTSTVPDEEDDHQCEVTDPTKPDIETLCRNDFTTNSTRGGSLALHSTAVSMMPSAFCIFEDDAARGNSTIHMKSVESRTFEESPIFKPAYENDEVWTTESLVKDCSVWAARNKTLASSPTRTRDFSTAAPASNKQPEHTWKVLEDKENAVTVEAGCNMGFDDSEDIFVQAYKKMKLSPIQENSPEQARVVAPSPSSCSMVTPQVAVQADEVESSRKRLAECRLSNTSHHSALNVEDPWGVTTQPFIVCDNGDVEEETPPSIQKPEQVIVENAWDDDLLTRLLSQLPTPLSSLSNYHQWQTNVPSFKLKSQAKLGSQSFSIDHLIGEGAFAHVYQASIVDPCIQSNQRVILKVQKPGKPWEFYIGTQITQRMKPEIRHLYIEFHSAHIFQNGSVLEGDLFGHGSLLNAINLYKTLTDKVMPVPLVIYFAINILYIVEQLHNISIIHGDIKPDNFALGEKFMKHESCNLDLVSHGLALIDLGQSIDMTLFPKGAVFTGKCETSGFQCTEMLSNKPWNYQTDYFGVAGTVYCMLFGNYMKVCEENGVWRPENKFKRFPHRELWVDFFHTLLNVPDCHSPSPLKDLREKLTKTFQSTYAKKIKPLRNKLVILLLENKPSKK